MPSTLDAASRLIPRLGRSGGSLSPVPIDETANPYVGRAGLKLRHALDTFGVNPHGLVCADFGCNVGGFTDCLLQAGARQVYALDTGYGVLDWKLRNDPRVVVMERTNALHAPAPQPDPAHPAGVDLIAVDMGWTPQKLCIPAALRWLKPPASAPGSARIITLIKPHYEASAAGERVALREGVLDEATAEQVFQRVIDSLPLLGVRVEASTRSPLVGGAGKGKSSRGRGNIEFLALLAPAATA